MQYYSTSRSSSQTGSLSPVMKRQGPENVSSGEDMSYYVINERQSSSFYP